MSNRMISFSAFLAVALFVSVGYLVVAGSRPDPRTVVAELCVTAAAERLGVGGETELPEGFLSRVRDEPEVEGEPHRYRFQTSVEFPRESGDKISSGFVCVARSEGFFRNITIEEVLVGNQYR